MKSSWSALVVIAGLMVTAGASASHAQISSPIGFGLVGGSSSPAGPLSDLAKSGWHAGAFLELNLPVVPVGFRLEGAWHQFHDKPIAGGGGSTGARIEAGTLNATYTLLPLPIIKPYLIGGVGEYNVRLTTPVVALPGGGTTGGTTTQTKTGMNVGAGVRVQLGGFAAFVEARWHDVFTSGKDVQMVPVSVGLRF
ncbi:MAG TPA: outer membrane beta-barrel protein [Gemmatimonadaceae bacterium]|nr:outer membrane beta-barrel protein [Gemmatimonadaceae bacterium]